MYMYIEFDAMIKAFCFCVCFGNNK